MWWEPASSAWVTACAVSAGGIWKTPKPSCGISLPSFSAIVGTAATRVILPERATRADRGYIDGMAPVGKLMKLALAAKVAADNLSTEDRERVVKALNAAGNRLRPARKVSDAQPLTVATSKHKGVFQVVMVDALLKPFEDWVREQGLRTYPIPGLDENDLETLGVAPGDDALRRR